MKEQKRGLFFRCTYNIVSKFYKKTQIQGLENLPDTPCIIIGNHAQAHGPLIAELKFPFKKKLWYNSELIDKSKYPEYAMNDFWRYKPRGKRWFYRAISRMTTWVFPCLLKGVCGIPVYRDSRVIITIKKTIESLKEGYHVVIFPERHEPFNKVVNEFQQGFVDLAKLYFNKTGKILSFVPLYNAPKLKKSVFGKPIFYNPNISIEEERSRICNYLKSNITELAESLPPHTVVPYANIHKRKYPKSK